MSISRDVQTTLVIAVLLGQGVLAAKAQAVIERPLPLDKVVATSDQVLVAKVTRWDPQRPAAVLTIERTLKGDKPFDKMTVRLAGDKETETSQLLERLAAEVPVAVFVSEFGGKPGCLMFTNGTWFQLVGEKSDDGIKWRFTHMEPYLRRTYKGTTAELTKTLDDFLAGKAKTPPLDPKEKPGIGPPLTSPPGK